MEKIKRWIRDSFSDHGYGDDFGYGFDFGSGSGYGDDFGNGSGDGDDFGNGSGFSDGSGYGHGIGSGYDSGHGHGFGYGDGNGSGNGDGFSDGSGYGCDVTNNHGVKEFMGRKVYIIDNVATIIDHVSGTVAKGAILNADMTLQPCYIVKGNGLFAHGETLIKARDALISKILETMEPEEAIEEFLDKFKHGKKYKGTEFYEWHHYLTGSCEMGRDSFVRNHGIDLEDEITVEEFIAYCEDDFGGEIIKQLKERWMDQ